MGHKEGGERAMEERGRENEEKREVEDNGREREGGGR